MNRFLNNNAKGIEIGRLLSERGLTMATAESCTGGTIASMVTAVSGSSAYFKGGVVSYAVSVKERVLGVELKEGVVSEDTALQMAMGACRVCDSDCAVASTGIAGPGGAEPDKPVGTVCLAAVRRIAPEAGQLEKWGGLTKTFVFEGDREAVILQAADAALELLEHLLALKD